MPVNNNIQCKIEKNYTLVENVTDYKAMLLGVMASMSEEDISLVDSMENNSIQSQL